MMTYYMTETTAGNVLEMEQKYGSEKSVNTNKNESTKSFLRSVGTHLTSKFADYRKRQQAKHELYGMSNRELSDMGISRMQIETVVDGPAKPSFIKRGYHACKEFVSRRMKERAGYTHLMRMDDRQLEDLGLTRNLVERAANDQLPSAHNDNNPASVSDNGHRTAV